MNLIKGIIYVISRVSCSCYPASLAINPEVVTWSLCKIESIECNEHPQSLALITFNIIYFSVI